MPAGLIVLILALTLGIQPVTTDLYLPALPSLSGSFAAPMWQAQYTLSALLLAFGCSQLIWGPLSDRFGRRPVLLTGLLAYTLAALASTQAPSMLWLIVWRFLRVPDPTNQSVRPRVPFTESKPPTDAEATLGVE